MAAPFEIVAAPLTAYVAPVGTAFPLVSAAPAGTWFKLGTSGDKNYEREGVTVTHEQEITTFTPAGSRTPRKAWRTTEGLLIEFTLVDIAPEQYAKVMNDASVATTAAASGIPGTKDFNLLQGLEVKTFAMFARGLSSVDEQFAAQYQVPLCYQGADSIAPVYQPGEPAGLAVQFVALEDVTAGFGKLVIQTAAPL